MTAAVAVDHTFETGHRLPHIPGKCQSLHGHSWHVRVEVAAAELDSRGMVVEFGPFKTHLRQWIDAHLDHGLMLGHEDPLVPVLFEQGKVFTFTEFDGHWPTVENVALLLYRVANDVLDRLPAAPTAYVSRVDVRETSVNQASKIGEPA